MIILFFMTRGATFILINLFYYWILSSSLVFLLNIFVILFWRLAKITKCKSTFVAVWLLK